MYNDMLYDRAAMRATLQRTTLSSRGKKFIDRWLSAWTGGRLPAADSLPPDRFPKLKRLLLVGEVFQDRDSGLVAKITFSGDWLTRFLGMDITGLNWFSLIEPEYLPERTGRTNSVSAGALLKTTREVRLNTGAKMRFDTLSVPLRPDADGRVHILNYTDLPVSANAAVLAGLREVTMPPVRAEFVAIPVAAPPPIAAEAREAWATTDHRRKVISKASTRFVVKFMREAMRMYGPLGLDVTDYLLVLSIDAENTAHIHNDARISARYSTLVTPDWIRRGVSRAQVSRITQIPLETVRRRINNLIAVGVLAAREDGVILPEMSCMPSASRQRKMHINTQLVERLISDLGARGIPLPKKT